MFTPHHVSDVTCHLSRVTCQMSRVIFFLFFGQSGGASQWRVCYQRGLARLVSIINQMENILYLLKETLSLLVKNKVFS